MSRSVLEADWRTPAGLRGAVVGMDLGHRCGYVEVPWWHPWHGCDFRDAVTAPDDSYLRSLTVEEAFDDLGVLPVFGAMLSEQGIADLAATIGGLVRVHGGVTYADRGLACLDDSSWWLGFDCGHHTDARDPSLVRDDLRPYFSDYGGTLWTRDMVRAEVERMAVQVVGLAPGFDPDRMPFENFYCLGARELRRERRRRDRLAHG